jgi:hypothetical protein
MLRNDLLHDFSRAILVCMIQLHIEEEQSRHLLEILIGTYDGFILQRELLIKQSVPPEHTKKFIQEVSEIDDKLYILCRLILRIGNTLENTVGVNEEIRAVINGVLEFVNSSTFERHRDLEGWWSMRQQAPSSLDEASPQLPTCEVKSLKVQSTQKQEQDRPPF